LSRGLCRPTEAEAPAQGRGGVALWRPQASGLLAARVSGNDKGKATGSNGRCAGAGWSGNTTGIPATRNARISDSFYQVLSD
jgi:hypothetical protein